MNVYTGLAEWEHARKRLTSIIGYFEATFGEVVKAEAEPQYRGLGLVGGRLTASTYVHQELKRTVQGIEVLKAAIEMEEEALFHSLVWNYGHEIYIGEESPLVRDLIEVYAAMSGGTYEMCAKAMGAKYFEGWLGANL